MEKGGGEEGEKKSVRSQGKVRRDGSHKWAREGSGYCGRVVIEESGVSKSRRHAVAACDCKPIEGAPPSSLALSDVSFTV